LNAFAQSKNKKTGCRYLALNWGIWNEVGMAAKAADKSQQKAATPKEESVEHPWFDYRLGGLHDTRVALSAARGGHALGLRRTSHGRRPSTVARHRLFGTGSRGLGGIARIAEFGDSRSVLLEPVGRRQ
jgi:hypothetical protein